MYPYYNDYQFKISYDPQNNKVAFARNHCGAQAAVAIAVASYTYTDANSIFVDGTAGNDANAGTQAAPKKTLLNAMNACTATKTKVLITDSLLYAEELETMSNTYCEGVYAATGQTPTYTLRVLDFTPADGNAIFVDKTGADINAGTQAAPKLTIAGAIAATDGAHQAVVIQDSETYTEAGIEFTGNFKKLVAALGCNPTLVPTIADDCMIYDGGYELKSVSQNTDVPVVIDNILDSNDSIISLYAQAGAQEVQLIKFDIDGNQEIAKTSISGVSLSANHLGISKKTNGNVLAAWAEETILNRYAYVAEYSHGSSFTQVGTNVGMGTATYHAKVCTFSDDGFAVAYTYEHSVPVMRPGGFQIFNSSRVQTVANTKYSGDSATICHTRRLLTLPGDKFFILHSHPDPYFCIYDNSGAQIVAQTLIEAGVTQWADAKLDSSNNIVVVYAIGGAIKFVVYDTGGNIVQAATSVAAAGMNGYCDLNVVENDNIIFWYSDGANSYYQIFDSTYTQVLSQTTWRTTASTYIKTQYSSTGRVMINVDTATLGLIIRSPFIYSGLFLSTNAVVNGLILNGGTKHLGRMIYTDSSTVYTGWCSIYNVKNNVEITATSLAIETDDESTVSNCSIYDNAKGIYIATNNANVSDNLLYRNSGGYACHIKGTAAVSGDITFEHNTVFDNYNGLRLEDNHGTREIVKNNIIYGNDVYGIYAETAMSYTYSINTNTNYNATAGSGVIIANPLFINEGGYDPTDTDLKLKMRIAGYFADSPAYQLGDETSPDRDAGGWDVVYIGSATTWTSATIEKPVGGIGVSYVPVGEKTLVKKDGTIETAYDSWREVVEFSFVGILNADFTTLVALLMCGNNSVLLYPDPTTYPANYNQYTIIYKEINGDTKNFRLSQTGKQDVKIIMSRAYTP